MKKPAKATRKGIFLKGEGATDEGRARAVTKQRSWAHAVAAGIERGELPEASNQRRMIAAILRAAADQLRADTSPRRGNPNFPRKLPDDDTIALSVGYQIAAGVGELEAIRTVAEDWDVNESTVAKLFRARRDAVADWFEHSNFRHRVGAIRGE